MAKMLLPKNIYSPVLYQHKNLFCLIKKKQIFFYIFLTNSNELESFVKAGVKYNRLLNKTV